MYATIMSLSTLTFVFGAGITVCLLGLSVVVARHRNEGYRQVLATQAAIIEEQEATIGAYRESMALTMSELALTPQKLSQ